MVGDLCRGCSRCYKYMYSAASEARLAQYIIELERKRVKSYSKKIVGEKALVEKKDTVLRQAAMGRDKKKGKEINNRKGSGRLS